MKIIPNPAYEDAPWELGAAFGTFTPEEWKAYKFQRFYLQPPLNFWEMNDVDRNKWIEEHQIPPYIEVP